MDHVQTVVKKLQPPRPQIFFHPTGAATETPRQPLSKVSTTLPGDTLVRWTPAREASTAPPMARTNRTNSPSDTNGTVAGPAAAQAADSPRSPTAPASAATSEPQPTLVLLDRVRQGDGTAINGLLERHRAAIRRMIDQRMDRVVQRRVDASDIVQDVMIEANRRLGDYLANPTMPFQLWLRHMARDRLIDAHRRHRVAANRSLDREVSLTVPAGQDHSQTDLMGQLADRELTPAAAATWHELERRFAAAVEQLDEDDRKIVLLRHFEHLSTAEAADTLGLTKPAAGMRYLRAMRRLRILLDGGFDSLAIEQARTQH